MNRFVNDVVLRRDLADGWKLAGPDLRGGTTRASWVAGRGVTVEQFAARGRNFRNSWYATWVAPGEMGLTVTLRTGRGANRQAIDEIMVLTKRQGRWLVDELYPNGIFRLGRGHRGSCPTAKCAVTGMYDYAPSAGGAIGPHSAQIGKRWLWVVIGAVLGAPIAILLGVGAYVGRRNRRARNAYLASRSA